MWSFHSPASIYCLSRSHLPSACASRRWVALRLSMFKSLNEKATYVCEMGTRPLDAVGLETYD